MAESWKFVVEAGPHDRTLCPVSVKLPHAQAAGLMVELTEAKTRKKIPCQVLEEGEDALLIWMAHGLKAGRKQTVIGRLIAPVVRKPMIELRDYPNRGKVDVLDAGEVFTAYHYGRQWVRPFLHPLIGPSGVSVTRHWPIKKNVKGEHRDHPHHKSVWVAYGECGKVDNWSEEAGHGWQRHQRFLALDSGAVMGRLTALNYWCYPDERKQFEEVRELRFYRVGAGTRLLDIRVTFRMTEGPVTFRDTKEGGLISVRVASAMEVANGGRIENGFGGINEEETWGKPAPWCDYSGKVNGRPAGIALCDHPANPRYPTGWHVRDYGLMTANCFAWKYYRPEAVAPGDMEFNEGQETTWRYRLCVHRGNAQSAHVAQRFIDFAMPPKVRME